MTQQFKDPFIWKGNEWAFIKNYDSKSYLILKNLDYLQHHFVQLVGKVMLFS